MTRDRRLVWAVRLLLYPAVLALLALAWHQHRAAAAVKARNAWVAYRGTTGQRLGMTAWTVDGWLEELSAKLRLTCAGGRPELADTSVSYDQVTSVARIDGPSISGRWTGIPFTWTSGLRGIGSARFDGRLERGSLRGVLSLTVELVEDSGPLPCRSGPAGFVLRRR